MKMTRVQAEVQAPESDTIDQRIASKVREHRGACGLSLAELAERSGVSRSMISLIERGETSPTAALLEKLAAAFGVPLATLFDDPAGEPAPVSRRADQTVWRDPASGYIRRNVSPAGSRFQIVDVDFPPGRSVTYETTRRKPLMHHQVWVLDGTIEVTVGDRVHVLSDGDCLAFVLDSPTAYRNRSKKPARYAVVIVEEPS